MSILAPVILLPTNGVNYSTDVATQTISGTTATGTEKILVNGSALGVSFTPLETIWAWTGTIVLGANTLNVIAVENVTEEQSDSTTIVITLIQTSTFITVSPPSGCKVLSYQDKMQIACAQNTETQTVGYNFYVSTQSGGINGVYVKINPQPVTLNSFYEDQTTEISTSIETVGNLKVTTLTEEVTRVYYYSATLTKELFNAMVAAGLLPDVTFGPGTDFFFVTTAVIYDSITGQVTESANSQELESSPLVITTGIQDLPPRSQNDIVMTFGSELLATNAGIDTKPGTVVRDIIDPVSDEMARVYVIQDFISRSQGVSSLLDFDDANGDGVSDPVTSSVVKRKLQVALNITDPSQVQRVIDDQFDKLASNVNVIRMGAQPAVGTVIFYVEVPPVRDMYVYEGAIVSSTGNLDQGIASQNYQCLTSKVFQAANKDTYYNTTTKRYELSMDVQAVTAGAAGNTDSYTIVNVSSGVDSDFRVENPNPIAFGQDRESNHDLATRIQLALFADTGTEGGYAKTAVSVPGVHYVRVEKAGDPLMVRDYDPIRAKHIGGKVDIYIRGSRSKQVSDQIAFSFESIAAREGLQSGEIYPVLNVAAFQFKCINPRVTAHTPIFEVTRVYNSTRAQDYDITGYQIIGEGTVIDLDEFKPTNIAVGLATRDVIRVDYKFRSSDTFIMQSQPVNSIVSVVGQLSGTLTPDNYELVSLQDPLADGRSTIAQDGIRIKFANNLPLTEFQTITDESHVIILGVDEPLDFVGADPLSIVIRNTGHTVTYREDVDYRVLPGTDTAPTTFRLIETGSLVNGQDVLVSYTAIENFTITYITNGLLQDVQTKVDKMKHACADVIVKGAIENSVDFVMTIIPKANVTNTQILTSSIRTTVANYLNQLGVGKSLTQSEVIHLIQQIGDVDYVVIPFLRMVKGDGSLIVRDDVGQATFELFNEGVAASYITTIPVLTYTTIDKGGSENMFRGVFENKMPLVLQDTSLDVSGGPGRAYIEADGKIIVSTRDGQLPDTKIYQVAYYVYGELGAKDINVATIESLAVGNMNIIYDTSRQNSIEPL